MQPSRDPVVEVWVAECHIIRKAADARCLCAVTVLVTDWTGTDYAERSGLQRAMIDEAVARLDFGHDDRVRDVGCGEGFLTSARPTTSTDSLVARVIDVSLTEVIEFRLIDPAAVGEHQLIPMRALTPGEPMARPVRRAAQDHRKDHHHHCPPTRHHQRACFLRLV